MKAEKYCGLCGQKIEIEYEPRQPVRVILAIMMEFYAILALLASFLMLNHFQF